MWIYRSLLRQKTGFHYLYMLKHAVLGKLKNERIGVSTQVTKS